MRDSRRRRVVVGILIVISLTLILLDLRGDGGPLSGIRSVGASVLGGIQSAASGITTPVVGFFGSIGNWGDQTARISDLENEVARLEAELKTVEVDKARIEELNELLRVAGAGQYLMLPAQVISVGPAQGFAWTVTLDAGSNDGIEPEQSVINGQGLVGRVLEVTENTATVLLIVDSTSSVGARVAGSNEIGILSGSGRQDVLEFQLLDPSAPVDVGDALVTYGSRGGRPYAPGIPIGEVLEVSGTPGQLTRIAVVKPFVDISTLDLVGVVVQPPRVDPRDAVLPDAPVDTNPTTTPEPDLQTAEPIPTPVP